MCFRKILVEHGLQSVNSDLFSFPKSVMLTRCAFLKPRFVTIAAYGLESVAMTRSLCRQIDASHRQMVSATLGIAWPETMSTVEHTQRAKLIPLYRTIRKHRLRLVGHVTRLQSRFQTPLGTLLTTVLSNCHLRQGHGRTSTLQHNVADDLRSINCDVTSISGMTTLCFFNLVDTLALFVCVYV